MRRRPRTKEHERARENHLAHRAAEFEPKERRLVLIVERTVCDAVAQVCIHSVHRGDNRLGLDLHIGVKLNGWKVQRSVALADPEQDEQKKRDADDVHHDRRDGDYRPNQVLAFEAHIGHISYKKQRVVHLGALESHKHFGANGGVQEENDDDCKLDGRRIGGLGREVTEWKFPCNAPCVSRQPLQRNASDKDDTEGKSEYGKDDERLGAKWEKE